MSTVVSIIAKHVQGGHIPEILGRQLRRPPESGALISISMENGNNVNYGHNYVLKIIAEYSRFTETNPMKYKN